MVAGVINMNWENISDNVKSLLKRVYVTENGSSIKYGFMKNVQANCNATRSKPS
jgi:hypothetical protein